MLFCQIVFGFFLSHQFSAYVVWQFYVCYATFILLRFPFLSHTYDNNKNNESHKYCGDTENERFFRCSAVTAVVIVYSEIELWVNVCQRRTSLVKCVLIDISVFWCPNNDLCIFRWKLFEMITKKWHVFKLAIFQA